MKRRDFMGNSAAAVMIGSWTTSVMGRSNSRNSHLSTAGILEHQPGTFLRKMIRNLGQGKIANLAGVGTREGTEASSTDVGWPHGVVRNKSGELIVVDYQRQRIWRIDRQGILHNFAGDGVPGFAGDGGPALHARFNCPHDLWQDSKGNLFISDLLNYRIRHIDAITGIITTVAGCGIRGDEGDGGPAVQAQLNIASGIATNSQGDLYISDEIGCSVRHVDSKGIIRRFAGIGLGGYNGDNKPALEAALYHPEHLYFDSKDNLYICDNSNDRIRMVDKAGIITTKLGNPIPAGIDGRYSRSSSGDGGPATEASTLMPDSIAIDRHDNLYVGEKYGFRVRRVDARTGIASTVVGTGVPGFGEDGDVGERTLVNSQEVGLWIDPDNSVLFADMSGRLRKVDGRTRIVTTLLGGTHVGDGGPCSGGFLTGPNGIHVSADQTIYFADTWNMRIRAIDGKSGQISTVAGSGGRAYGGDGDLATRGHLGNPLDVTGDREGNLYIADSRNSRIRRVSKDGVITTYAGNGLPWDGGDGGPAVSAQIIQPLSVLTDPQGNVYVGDTIGRIRRIQKSTGVINTVVGIGIRGYKGDGGPATKARISAPFAMTFDREGNLYFADTGNNCIRKVDSNGRISTIVGTGESGKFEEGTGVRGARISGPRGVAVDSRRVVYFSDSGNNRICAILPDGKLMVIAGNGDGGDSGDGDDALRCKLNFPTNLAFVEPDCLIVSDHFNSRVRMIKVCPTGC